MQAPLAQLSKISVSLEGKPILLDVTLDISPHGLVTLVGPNGAGKSTLLKVILGFIPPSQGTLLKQPGLRIGYMPQKLKLDTTLPLTVEGFFRLSRRFTPESLQDMSSEVGISSLLHCSLHELSGGEMQRVLLARALMGGPHLLILDEPAQGLDIHGQRMLYRLITEACQRRKCAALIVSHDLHFVMAASAEVICLNKHICCAGQPSAVQQHPQYQALFGDQPLPPLAFYTHHHDHAHDDHRNASDKCEGGGSFAVS